MTTASSTVLGRNGELDGRRYPGILLEQPACAEWICRKLFRQFVSESHSPSEPLLAPLAQAFRESNYQIKVPVERILRSSLFFDAARAAAPGEEPGRIRRGYDPVAGSPQPDGRGSGPGRGLRRRWVRASMRRRASPAGKVDRPGSTRPRCSPAPTWPCASSPRTTRPSAGVATRDRWPLATVRAGPTQAARFLLDLLVSWPLDPKVRDPIVKAAASKDAGPDAAVRDAARRILTLPEYQLT